MHKFNLLKKFRKKRKLRNFAEERNIFPNLIQQNFSFPRAEIVWYTDVTYLIFNKESCFLSAIIDGKTKAIVAFHLSRYHNWNLIKQTLNKALKNTKNRNKIIIHSDQGTIYTSHKYQKYCEKHQLVISHSNKGNPVDNAPIEAFFANFKKEVSYNHKFPSMKKYLVKAKQWLHFYNHERIRFKNN